MQSLTRAAIDYVSIAKAIDRWMPNGEETIGDCANSELAAVFDIIEGNLRVAVDRAISDLGHNPVIIHKKNAERIREDAEYIFRRWSEPDPFGITTIPTEGCGFDMERTGTAWDASTGKFTDRLRKNAGDREPCDGCGEEVG